LAVGESYLNAPLNFAIKFVSEDPDTQVRCPCVCPCV
jgi:hypothetical protein